MKLGINDNGIKHLSGLLISMCLIFILLVPGCNQAPVQPEQSSQPKPEPTQISIEPLVSQGPLTLEKEESDCGCGDSALTGGGPAGIGPAPFGLYANLEFDRAPKTNETMNLSWCIKAAETFKELHAWVQFDYDSGKPGDSRKLPIKEVEEKMLLEGQLSFDGSLKEGEEKHFDAVIKFPVDGKWKIGVYFFKLDLTQSASAGIPYYAGKVQRLYITEEHGQFGFPEYYQGEGQVIAPTDLFPISGYVDMGKPPVLNEPAEITWGAGSIKDVEGVNFHLIFEYLEPGGRKRIPVPSEELIVSGDASQSIGSMNKDELFKSAFDSPAWNELDKTPRESIIERASVHFSTIAKFPKEGDWSVKLTVDWVDNAGQLRRAMTNILCFNISRDGSAWGWKGKHF